MAEFQRRAVGRFADAHWALVGSVGISCSTGISASQT